ncbi:TIGR03016 family PEP-CTERM system-associated outer membrane protein [Trichlorobacter ammonificans]|uniref:TIGR03016 family PEP-CTERM system-associated outer membrane protein n=1 Tax=Trichlorobacter ammonificans TaxID=2916410 RepID=A0ABN8HJF6_9BACT|nr:TIGR03016 family PEP-CTERM system-associated outer membrane protein [Trichlorobacter ammonificans]CAH2031359.1 conserved protein of unknown function [Trichlorobacter ammonificans]
MLKSSGVFIMGSIVVAAAVAQGAEFEVHPSLTVSEEYTDNVFESRTNRLSDFITRALPGVSLSYKAPAFTGDLNYQLDYRHYAKKRRDDEITHLLAAKGYLVAVNNLLYLDVTDDYQRVSLDVARDVSKESLFLNQSDRNVVAASPYFKLNLTDRTLLKTGYRFVDTRYFDSPAINKMDHIGFAELTHALSQGLELTAGYTFTRELANNDNFNQHLAFGGFRYEYAEKSFLFAQGGNSWTRYDHSDQRLSSAFWNAGITHQVDTVTATVTTGKHYVEDPLRNIVQETFVTGTLEKRFKNGLVSIAPIYSEFKQTETGSMRTKKYGGTARGQCELSSDLSGTLSFTAEKYEQPQQGSYTRRLLASAGLSYLLAEQLTLSLSYYYADYYSPGIATDNYHVNRGIVEIRKVF